MKKHTPFKRFLQGAAASAALVVSSVAVAGYGGLIFTPTSGNFGALPVGSTSTVQTFTATTDFGGTRPEAGIVFSINSITLPAGFVRSGGTCPASGSVTDSCTIGIQFQPTTAGLVSGNVVVNSTVLGGTQNNNLPVIGQGLFVTQLPANNAIALGALLASLALAGMFFSRRR
jgi:hypothetical protein